MTMQHQSTADSPVKQALREIRRLKAELDAERSRRTEPLAIVGMGLRYPGGVRTPEQFWSLLADGVNAVGPIPRDRWPHDDYYDPDMDAAGHYYVQKGGFLEEVDRFDPEFFGIAPVEAISMDPQQRLLLETTWEALENAGIPATSLQGSRTGVFVGIAGADYHRHVMADRSADTHASTGTLASVAAGRISYVLGLNGPAVSLDTACSSSLVAIHLATRSLRACESDVAIAGGVSLMLSPDLTVNFCRAGMLSRDGRCRTFDASADGYVRSEGCGVVVLKRLSDAQRDGDRVLGLVRGSAINQDGRSSGLTAPSGPAQEAVIRAALADAGANASEVRYVEAHGTGTPLGDPIEVQAIGAVFSSRSREDPVLLGSVKTNLGHLEGSAGIAGLMKAVLALQHRRVPPHLHFERPNPYISWDELPVEVAAAGAELPAEGDLLAGVSSFGFSGTNAHVVVAGPPEMDQPARASVSGPDVLVLSAPEEDVLPVLALAWADHLESGVASYADLCETSRSGRVAFPRRIAVVAGNASEAAALLRSWAEDGKVGAVLGGGDDRLSALAERWAAGEQVEWSDVRRDDARRTTAPTYPFRRRRFWYDRPEAAGLSKSDVWTESLKAAESRALVAPVDTAVATYEFAWEALNRLTFRLGRNALAELGAFGTPGETLDLDGVLDRTGIRETYRRIIGRWLEQLADEGVIERTEQGFSAAEVLGAVDTDADWERVGELLAGDRPLLDYVRHSGGMVREVLAGRTSALETLFPGGSFDMAVRLYHESSLLRYVNGIAAAALERFVAARPEGAPIRVMEIGAGTGGTTGFLTPVLPPERSEYLYTDVSDIFLDFAEERFADVPFLRTGLFDLEKDPAEQGVAEASWDVVVAANVIHAAKDIRAAVERARRLLAPGGLLLLVESTGHHPWHDITTGLIEGWQHFEDDLRDESPLLTPDVWVELLHSAGFEAAATLPGEGSPAGILKQHLVMASVAGEASPATEVRRKSVEAPRAETSAPAATVAAEVTPEPAPAAAAVSAAMAAILAAPEGDQEEMAIGEVREAVIGVLRLEADRPPSRDARLLDLGLDSLMAVRLRNVLQKRLELPEPLPSTLVFDYPTIRQIARFILEQYGAPTGTETGSDPYDASADETDLAGMSDAEVEALLMNRLNAEEFR